MERGYRLTTIKEDIKISIFLLIWFLIGCYCLLMIWNSLPNIGDFVESTLKYGKSGNIINSKIHEYTLKDKFFDILLPGLGIMMVFFGVPLSYLYSLLFIQREPTDTNPSS